MFGSRTLLVLIVDEETMLEGTDEPRDGEWGAVAMTVPLIVFFKASLVQNRITENASGFESCLWQESFINLYTNCNPG